MANVAPQVKPLLNVQIPYPGTSLSPTCDPALLLIQPPDNVLRQQQQKVPSAWALDAHAGEPMEFQIPSFGLPTLRPLAE